MHPLSRALVLCLLASFPQATARAQGWSTAGGETLPVGAGAQLAGASDPAATLEALLAARAPADGPAHALAVRLHGKPLFAGARGLADLEHGLACTPDAVFDMASLAKSVTAAAVLSLSERDRLDLDDPVRKHLPELAPAFDAVTLRHLLHHTAGIEDVDGLLALAGWRAHETASFADELGVLLGQQHLRFAPGTMHAYSNGGYVLLAEVVRRAGGEPLPAWARAHVFDPLGMKSARIASERGELVARRVEAYSGPATARRRHEPGASHGAGGFLCSVVDLAAWGQELAEGRVLGAPLVARLRERGALADGTPVDYAAGIVPTTIAGHAGFRHSGSLFGMQSSFAFFPEQGLVVAAATSDGDAAPPYALVEQVVELLLGAAPAAEPQPGPRMRMIPEDQPAPEASRGVAVDPARLALYDGTYLMSEGPELTFRSAGTRLRLGFGGDPTIEVFPLPSGRFVLPPVGYEFSFEPERARVTMHVSAAASLRGEARELVGTRWTPAPLTDDERDARVGNYVSDELGSHYQVRADARGLTLVHARHGRMELAPRAPGVYSVEGRELDKLRFVLSEGRVVGFELEAVSWNAKAFFRRL